MAKHRDSMRGYTPRHDIDRQYATIKKVVKVKYVSRLMGLKSSMETLLAQGCPGITIRKSLAIEHCYDAVQVLKRRLLWIRENIVRPDDGHKPT